MALSQHQDDVLHDALEILETSKRLVIRGSAGVGKTYLVDELLKRLSKAIPKYKSIYCSAPTNKAVAILAGKITEKGDNVSLITVASVLKIGPHTDKNTGAKTFIPQLSSNPRYLPLAGVALLIVDESSMVGLQYLKWIEEHATTNKTTVIFIGDDKQLNPVKEQESPVFLGKPHVFTTAEDCTKFSDELPDNQQWFTQKQSDDEYICFVKYPEVELTEIVRQGAGNPIIRLSRNLSAIWELEGRLTEDKKGFVYTIDKDRIINELATINGSDELKYLAWTNNEVDEMNTLVRERIYTNPARVELGESLIFDEPYFEYFINQEIKVETLDIVNVPFKVYIEDVNSIKVSDVSLKCYVINGKQVDEWNDGKLVWRGIFILHEDADEQFAALVKLLKFSCMNKKLKWTTKNAFEAMFANTKYNHAITVHKSQGSTYQQVILNVGNINRNPTQAEKTRLYYTGITRASDLLILYNINNEC